MSITFDFRAASGSTGLDLGPRDESWDASAAEKSLQPADYPDAHFYRDMSKPADEIGAYKLPFAHRTDGGLKAVWRGVTAAAGGHGVNALTGVSDTDKAQIRKKINAYYAKARAQYGDDTIASPFEQNTAAPGELEVRFAVAPIVDVDVRDSEGNGDGTWTMSGYAAVFDQPTVLYDGRFVRLSESIDPAAFDTVLRQQQLRGPEGVVHFNFGHDMNRAVAATDVPAGQAGWLDLRADRQGLFFLAKVSSADPDAIAMAAKMRTGVLKQASFAFTVSKADYTTADTGGDGPEETHRRVLEVGHLYDVCATPQGAYPQTVSQLRSIAAAIGQPDETSLGAVRVNPTLGGASDVSPQGGAASRAQLLAAARIARHKHERQN